MGALQFRKISAVVALAVFGSGCIPSGPGVTSKSPNAVAVSLPISTPPSPRPSAAPSPLPAQGVAYYFSTSTGDDTRTPAQAKDPATPWKSLSKANSIFTSLNPGDALLFKKGETFYGTLIVTKPGTVDKPILISSYGTGERPVFSGFETLGAWNNLGGGIYESQCLGCQSTLALLTVNGVNTGMGRYPNANSTDGGFLSYESYTGNTSITDNQLVPSPNWSGAEVVIRKNYWILDANKITSHTGSTLTYEPRTAYANEGTGHGYFIQNDPRTLDQFGEWYFNPNTKKVQMYFGDAVPGAFSVKVASLDNLVLLKQIKASYVTFQNLAFEGANKDIVLFDSISLSESVTITDCRLSFAGDSGIRDQNSRHFLLKNSLLEEMNNNGYKGTNNENFTIRNNTFRNIGLIPGMGLANQTAETPGTYKAIEVWLSSATSNQLIRENDIQNIGYIGIFFHAANTTVENNFVKNFMQVLGDGGGIYTYSDSLVLANGMKILNNIVLNGGSAANTFGVGSGYYGPSGNGLYTDGISGNVEMAGNTIAYMAGGGIHMNNPRSNSVHDNLIFDTGRRSIDVTDITREVPPASNTIVNNSSYAFTADQKHFLLSGGNFGAEERVFGFGTSDSNLYLSFNGLAPTFRSETFGSVDGRYHQTNYSFADWKARTGRDLNSRAVTSAKTKNDVEFLYNASMSATTIPLSRPMTDAQGNHFTGTVTLQPYRSIVLIAD